ncbi:DUF6538 domain-containing protein [Rhodovulum steppense]|nr:DUF6538 domain-containing protein [Rhodovulum steppense]
MPKPILIGSTYYLRVHVPVDVAEKVKGTVISVPVEGVFRSVTIKGPVKVSLRTKDGAEAKRRFATAYAAVEAHWEAIRSGPEPLTHKQSLALAGALRAAWIDAWDEEPGNVEMWEKVQKTDMAALDGRLSPMPLIGKEANVAASLERRFGGMTDALLRAKGILVADESRPRLLQHVAEAMTDAGRINLAKASGDYSDDGTTNKYPEYVEPAKTNKGQRPSAKPTTDKAAPSITFGSVIDDWAASRASGRDATPLRPSTERKYRLHTAAFAEFRGNDDVTTVTAQEGKAWRDAMLAEAKLSNSTIAQYIQNVRTVITRGIIQHTGELFPYGNPLGIVELPSHAPVPSDQRTLTLKEAEAILRAARKELRPDLRWLPWLCAYSGARINEVAQLRPGDFFHIGGDWFYRLTTMGGKTLKNWNSERRVPVHPDLIAEGLIDFVTGHGGNDPNPMFPRRSGSNVSTWVREDVGLKRKEMAPSHGWRHLFEDKALVAGMSDAARLYITGRSGGGSSAGYGKSEVMLPGLAKEMRKIAAFLSDIAPKEATDHKEKLA